MQFQPAEELIFAPRILTKEEWPPNYLEVLRWRAKKLQWFKEHPELIAGMKSYYRDNPALWVTHWVDTYSPWNAGTETPTRIPFVLYQRQEEFLTWLYECLKDQQSGLCDKSREVGATWLASVASIHLWLFWPGVSIGWGSRKSELVDKLGVPDTIFEKMRQCVWFLPPIFWPVGFDPSVHMTAMRFINPENGSTITGEGGDNIGRGGRKTIYFKDESAHYEHAELIEAALMQNTRVQIDISTPFGLGTVFDRKKEASVEWTPGVELPSKTIRKFTFDWSDDPRKSKDWYESEKQAKKNEGLLHLFKQEVDRDPAGALQGIIIPPEWVRAAIDAHLEIKGMDLGGQFAGFDVCDEGGDLHAAVLRKGWVIDFATDWSEGDTGEATRELVTFLQDRRPVIVQYDSVGIGAGVKTEANRLVKDDRTAGKMKGLMFCGWDGGAKPLHPKQRLIRHDTQSPLIEDFYVNLKAQGWWELRLRFERTWRMRNEKGLKFKPDQLISISSKIPRLRQLMKELSQPVIAKSSDLRLLVDKKPDGAKSPNLGDATMMCCWPVKVPLNIPDAFLKKAPVHIAQERAEGQYGYASE